MPTRVFSAQQGTLIVGALELKEGLAPGGFLTLKPAVQFSSSRDVRGNVCRVRVNNPITPIEVKLMNWSPHNEQLSALHAADTLSDKGVGLGVFTWLDTGGATKIASTACWIVQAPDDWTVGEEAFEVTWKLEAVLPPEARIFGGN